MQRELPGNSYVMPCGNTRAATVLRHLPFLLPEEVPEILKRKADADINTVYGGDEDGQTE